MPPLQDCDIGLLIGYNCPQALAPRGCITGEDNQPFAIQTVLGWSVVGCIDAVDDSGDIIGLSHKVITTRVPEELRLPGQTQEISRYEVTAVNRGEMNPSVQIEPSHHNVTVFLTMN